MRTQYDWPLMTMWPTVKPGDRFRIVWRRRSWPCFWRYEVSEVYYTIGPSGETVPEGARSEWRRE